jgi:hypothetical protein
MKRYQGVAMLQLFKKQQRAQVGPSSPFLGGV